MRRCIVAGTVAISVSSKRTPCVGIVLVSGCSCAASLVLAYDSFNGVVYSVFQGFELIRDDDTSDLCGTGRKVGGGANLKVGGRRGAGAEEMLFSIFTHSPAPFP